VGVKASSGDDAGESRARSRDGGEGEGRVFGGEHDDESLPPDAVVLEDESDFAGIDPREAEKHARYLQQTVFGGFTVGIMHGKLSAERKREVMDEFRAGRIDVLVATTVIEVGVDVPNATAMLIEDADRFGLAQLHQLRGRVGRGDVAGEVCLVSGSRAPIALQRLQAMERIEDGFKLSEYDLALRREGDILGNRQHGASTLKLVNIMRDRAVIEAAHADAAALLNADPELAAPEHAALRRELRLMMREG
jgi:ATP-dependent DNA helicase RecG